MVKSSNHWMPFILHMIGTYLWAVAQVCEEGNTKDAAKVVESTSNRHVGMKE